MSQNNSHRKYWRYTIGMLKVKKNISMHRGKGLSGWQKSGMFDSTKHTFDTELVDGN